MATAMAMAMATMTKSEMEMATAMAMETATARATITKEVCLFMWWQCAALLDGQHLASTPMDVRKINSPALHHGGDTAKCFCSPSRGRVPDS
jgi:hypothetical protein